MAYIFKFFEKSSLIKIYIIAFVVIVVAYRAGHAFMSEYFWSISFWGPAQSRELIFGTAVVCALAFCFHYLLRHLNKRQKQKQEDDFLAPITHTEMDFICKIFECSRDDAEVIASDWHEIGKDAARLATPSVYSTQKLFSAIDKAENYIARYSDNINLDPNREPELEMFKIAQSINLRFDRIGRFCRSLNTIIDASASEVQDAYGEFADHLNTSNETQEIGNKIHSGFQNFLKISGSANTSKLQNLFNK